jgi:tRNA-guanine family transglycosylase
MSKAFFVPAIAEQFNNIWIKGTKYKNFDLKFFTKHSHFQHPFALQCAHYGLEGAAANEKNYRESIGFPKDKILLTDSGGYQLASFERLGKQCNISPIDSLRWQEENADVAMNLDVPSTLYSELPTYDKFNTSLKQSIINFTLFAKERKNFKMKLYNVMHGETLPLMDLWYNAVKHFAFDGWAIGVKPASDPMLQALGLMFLYEKGELTKENCHGVHMFGTSGKNVVPTIVYFASKLQNKLVTFDSSSYNVGSIYRTYYMPFDIGPHFFFGDKFKVANPHLQHLPCQCPVCNSIENIEILNGADIHAPVLLSLHNMYQYIYYNNMLNDLVNEKEQFINYLKQISASEKTLKSIEFIDFAMEHGIYNAADKFKNDLMPQQLVTNKQVDIWNF